MSVVWGWVVALSAIALVVAVWRDRARMRNAVLLGVLVAAIHLWALVRADPAVDGLGWELGLLVVTLRAVLIVALLLPAVLVINGLVMWRRETRRLGNLLSLLAGFALGAVVISVLLGGVVAPRWVQWPLAGVVLATAYLGYAALCLLVYSWFYRAMSGRVRPQVIVVLGAGLRGRRPTPLLARRLDRARQVWQRERRRGGQPRLVVSGGRGPDEEVSEAFAMAGHLVEHDVPRAAVLTEDRSRNTEENLRFSAELIAAAGLPGPVVVVTSDYHVLRTAFLAARLGLSVDVLGAPTVRYYQPCAYLREFAALLYPQRWVHLLVVLVLLGAPSATALLG